MVDLEHFREPQRHVAHVEVDAPNPQPWPERLVPLAALDTSIVGAG